MPRIQSNNSSEDSNKSSDRSESKADRAEQKAEKNLRSDVAKEGYGVVNEEVVNRVKEQRRTSKSGATKFGVASAESLLGGKKHETHEVKAGENLTTIARKHLGAKSSESEVYGFIKETAKLNSIKNPNLIHPGDKLELPLPATEHGKSADSHKNEKAEHGKGKPAHEDGKAADHSQKSQDKAEDKSKDKTSHPEAKQTSKDSSSEAHKGANPLDWINHGGDSLARQVAEKTPNGGLMLLGPADTMRSEAANYKDPEGYFPVFTHADKDDFHLYYGMHQGRKEYSAEALAEIIKQNVPEGQPIRLLGCESGLDGNGGVAHELARLLPKNPIYAPNGYCQLKDGQATVLLKKPSEMHWGEDPPKGSFVRIKP